jgi:hypothetical protein
MAAKEVVFYPIFEPSVLRILLDNQNESLPRFSMIGTCFVYLWLIRIMSLSYRGVQY